MSDIYFDTNDGTDISAYKSILQKTITGVLKKIEISDKGISWVIVEEEKFKEMARVSNTGKLLPIPSLVKEKHKYGCCDPKTKTIWISKEAIYTAPLPVENQLLKKLLNQLVDVILDELAHIETGKNHGDSEYEAKLASFKKKYYS